MLKKQLNELSIFALREVARRTGVSSPTSKKKEQLINEILAIKEGKIQPQLTKTRQGRPPKGVNYTMLDYQYVGSNSQVLSFKQKEAVFESQELSTVSGYVEFTTEACLLWKINKETQIAYFVPQQLIASYPLKTGDLIVCEASSSMDANVVKEILSINGNPVKKLKTTRKNYFDIESTIPNKSLSFEDQKLQLLNVKFGESVYLYGSSNNEKTLAVVTLLNNAKVDEKIYVNVSVAEKNKMYLTNLQDSENFISKITDSIDVAKRTIALATERAKRAFEDGKSVVVVLDDVLSIMSVDDEFKTLTKNIMSLTKCSKFGSITLFANMQGNSIEAIFERLVDKRFVIDGCNFKEYK